MDELTDVEETTPAIQDVARARSLASSLGERADGDAPLGRDLRADAGLAAARRPGARAATGVWVAAGYSGHGNVLGFACGELVADAILGDEVAAARAARPGALLGLERDVAAGRARPRARARRARSRDPGSRAPSSRTRSSRPASARPVRVAGEHVAELRSRRSRSSTPRLDRGGALPAVARLLPVVAEDAARGPARATAISALPGPSAPIRLTCCPGRSEPSGSSTSRPGVTVTSEVGRERLLAASGAAGRRAPRPPPRAPVVDVPDERRRGRARRTCAPPPRRSRRRRRPPRSAASARPSVSAASTAAAPVRTAVTAPASSSATRRPSAARRAARARSTVGRPRARVARGTTSPT